jgi:hypothetical protein
MSTINPSLLGQTSSLVDYLNKNSQGTTALGFRQYGNAASSGSAGTSLTDSNGDIVSLSPQAQALLAQAKTRAGTSSQAPEAALNKVQSNAQAFIANFFDANNIDISKASDETISLFQGLSELINDMQSPTSNGAIDNAMRKDSNGTRSSITLQESGHTVSFVIKYEGGKPSSMTVTNVTGSTAETAVIKLGKDADGKFASLNVTSEKNTYNRFGGKTGGVVRDALNFDLYKTDSQSTSDA